MFTNQNDPLVQILTAVGLDGPLIGRLKNETGITSVRNLALTLDDPWQDGSFAEHFGLTRKQVRVLAKRTGAGLLAKRPYPAFESMQQEPELSPAMPPPVAPAPRLVRPPARIPVLARPGWVESADLAHV